MADNTRLVTPRDLGPCRDQARRSYRRGVSSPSTTTWQTVRILEPEECLRLLASAWVARVGLTTDEGPQVLPVNHTVLDGAVYFRTTLDSTLVEGTRDAVVAVEADELSDRMEASWSVLAVGQATHVEDHAETSDVFARMREPWAPGSRTLLVKVVPTKLTGRRFAREG